MSAPYRQIRRINPESLNKSSLHNVKQNRQHPFNERMSQIFMRMMTQSRQKQSAGRNQAVLRLPIAHFRVPPTWWSLTGSNRRHPACKAGALPAELRPQFRCLKRRRLSQPNLRLIISCVQQNFQFTPFNQQAPSKRSFARPTGRRARLRALLSLSKGRRIAALAALIREDKTWWAWIDSNYRPHPYQGCALTT